MLIRKLVLNNLKRNSFQVKINNILIRTITKEKKRNNNKNNNNNEIEAEIIQEKEQFNSSSSSIPSSSSSPSSSSFNSSSSLNSLSNLFTKAVNKVKVFFGQDEETLERKRQEKIVNDLIDNNLRNLGLVGGIIGLGLKSLIKSVGNEIVNEVSNTNKDLELIQNETERLLSNHPKVAKILGDNIKCEAQLRLATKSTSVNGKVSKKIQTRYSVAGSKDEGCASIEATIDSKNVIYITSLLFQNTDGTFEIECDKKKPIKSVIIDV